MYISNTSHILNSYERNTSTINITSNSYGDITFEFDHPDSKNIEKSLSEDLELRNSIIGGQNSAFLQRIAKAHHEAFKDIPDGNQAAINSAQNWLQGFIKQTQQMPYVLRYQGETVSASFEDGKGKSIDYMNNFNVPKFS